MPITPHTELLTRHPANPIITAADLPYPANSVFNPAAPIRDGETTLLMIITCAGLLGATEQLAPYLT